MLTMIEAMLAFLFARAIWDYIKRRSQACQMIPLSWLLKVLFLSVQLILLIVAPLGIAAWILIRISN